MTHTFRLANGNAQMWLGNDFYTASILENKIKRSHLVDLNDDQLHEMFQNVLKMTAWRERIDVIKKLNVLKQKYSKEGE